MNKTDLIQHVATALDVSKVSAHQLVEAVFEKMSEALVEGEKVLISDFGTFSVSTRKGFEGKNPKSGEAMHVNEVRVATFKTGRGLKVRMNPEG